jgi:hypothetical protein
MSDFAYVGADRWTAGSHLLRVENRGRQDHQLRIARLREGSSVRDWHDAPEPRDYAIDVAGVARLGSRRIVYLPADLPRGDYVMYCLVADETSGVPHIELGMFRAIHVD